MSQLITGSASGIFNAFALVMQTESNLQRRGLQVRFVQHLFCQFSPLSDADGDILAWFVASSPRIRGIYAQIPIDDNTPSLPQNIM